MSFGKSWELAGVSARVLRADKELLVFPLVGGLLSVAFVGAVFVPAWFFYATSSQRLGSAAEALVVFTLYLVLAFIMTFFEAALCGAALVRLRGGDPTVMTGLRVAFRHVGVIFRFALISATVGLIIRSLEGRNGRRTLLSSFIGAAWSVATFMVVPVMVSEPVGAFDALKKSTTLLKKLWGDQLSGRVTMGFITFLGGLVLFLVSVPLIYVGREYGPPELLLGTGVGFLLGLVVLRIFSSALNAIFASALYLHATGEEVGDSPALAMVKRALGASAA